MDCLALTGSAPVPLALAAVAMIAAAVVLLVAVRRARSARRGHTGLALVVTAVLTVTMAGGLSLIGTSTAQAATDSCSGETTSSGSTTDAAATTTTEAASDAGQSVDAEETVPEQTTPDETTPDETTPEESIPEETTPEETTPEVEPVASILAVSFPEQTFETPRSAVSTESYTLVLSRVSGADDSSSVTLVVPDSADGYWTATALLEADGTEATDVTVTRASGETQFTIATQPTDSRTFLLVLQYDSSTWNSVPDGSTSTRTRPASTVLAWLADHADPANDTTSLQIPEYLAGYNGPPGGED